MDESTNLTHESSTPISRPTDNDEPEPFIFYGYEMIRFMSRREFDTILSVVLIIAELFCLMGVATNIINVVVFVKLGLRESTSISMMSLAISDFLLCALGLWCNLLYIAPFRNSGLSFRAEDMFILTGGTTRHFMARTSSLITAYITVERCLCVIFPLKIKSFITRRRTAVAMVTIYVITLGPSLFVFCNYYFVYRHYPDVNRTLLGVGYIYTDVNLIVDKIVTLLVGTVFVFISFVTTVTCTSFLIIYMSKASRWRQKTAAVATSTPTGAKSDSADTTAKRKDKTDRVIRMVVAIAIVFILCYAPGFAGLTLYAVFPGLTLYGKYGQLFQFIQGFVLFAETVNSSTNIFIYYFMGSSFRDMLQRIFGRK